MSDTSLTPRRRRHRIHRHHSRRNQEPHQESPPRCQERFLAYPSLLHPLRAPDRPQRPVQLPRPLLQEKLHLALHSRLSDGRCTSCRIFYQRRNPYLRNLSRQPRPLRRHPTAVRPLRRQPRAQSLRQAEQEQGPLDSRPRHLSHLRPLLWRLLHRRRPALDLAPEPRWCLEPARLDRYRRYLYPIPWCYESARENASPAFQELDVSMGSLDLCHLEYCSGSGARMEQL